MMSPLATFKPRRPESGPIPATLVTGFLGAGKTTLINHILRNRSGVRAAVLVNELGEIGIDNELIVGAEGGMVELGNGCVCCSTNSDLVDAVARVLGRPKPVDHILVRNQHRIAVADGVRSVHHLAEIAKPRELHLVSRDAGGQQLVAGAQVERSVAQGIDLVDVNLESRIEIR